MKINERFLSIPPFISTHWSRVTALHMKGSSLVVTLTDGTIVTIPNLPAEVIERIFACHADYLDRSHSSSNPMTTENLIGKTMGIEGEPSFRLAFGSMDGLNTMMQHNPAQSDAPNLPPEILQRVGAIAKILLPPGEAAMLPKAEEGCNCFYCQIARVLTPSVQTHEEIHEHVSDEDLKFQQWDIAQTGDKLFSVTNRLDHNEKYSVYLGQPIGCTCGKEGCEHILAVLKS